MPERKTQPDASSPPPRKRPNTAELDLSLIFIPLLGVSRWSSRVELYGTLQLMARRGLPLADGVREMTTEATAMPMSVRSRHYKSRLIYITQTLHFYLKQGATLSEAMARAGRIFRPHECAIVRAGERAGALPEALDALHSISRNASRRRQHFAAHIMYPLTLLFLVAFIVGGTAIFILPKMADIFAQLGAPGLPPLTQQVIDFFQALLYMGILEWLLALALFLVVAIIFRDVLYFVPVIGPWLRQNKLGQMLLMLGLQLRGGVPMDEALDTLTQLRGNFWAQWAAWRFRGAMQRGQGVGDALQSAGLLPRRAAAPVILAGQSGGLPDALIETARQMQEQSDARFLALIRSIEPVLVLIIAALTGIFIIALYLPLFGIPYVIR